MVLSAAMILTCSLSFANASNVLNDASGIGSGEDSAPVIHEEVIFDDGSPDPEKTRAKHTAKHQFKELLEITQKNKMLEMER